MESKFVLKHSRFITHTLTHTCLTACSTFAGGVCAPGFMPMPPWCGLPMPPIWTVFGTADGLMAPAPALFNPPHAMLVTTPPPLAGTPIAIVLLTGPDGATEQPAMTLVEQTALLRLLPPPLLFCGICGVGAPSRVVFITAIRRRRSCCCCNLKERKRQKKKGKSLVPESRTKKKTNKQQKQPIQIANDKRLPLL